MDIKADQEFLRLVKYVDPDTEGFHSQFWQYVCSDIFDGKDVDTEVYLNRFILPSHREYYKFRVEEQKNKVKAMLN